MEQYNSIVQEVVPSVDVLSPSDNADQKDTPFESTVSDLYNLVDRAFSKCLTAMIMSTFPFVCIFAIFIAQKGLNLVKQAEELSINLGTSAGGKLVASKVFGNIGKFLGIHNSIKTFFILLYISFFVLYLIFSLIVSLITYTALLMRFKF